MIRKFYAPDAATTPKYAFGGEEINFETAEVSTLNDEPPVEENEEVVEGKPEVTTEVKAEEKPAEEKKEEVKTEEKPPVITDWKEYVKKPEHRKEINALLEIDEPDEFVKKLITYRKENGNLTPFIEAATKDWDKISHDQLIMDDLKRQYSKLSPDKQEKLARSEFNQRFSYKEDVNLTEEENQEMAELAAIKLESEGEKIRDTRKSEQKQFLDSVKPVDRDAEVQRLLKEKQDSSQKEFEAFKNQVEASPVMSRLFTDKKIQVGSNGNSFNYTVNPEAIKEQTLDTNKFYSQFWDGEKFNQEKWNRVSAYSQDPVKYDEALINHGRSLGTKEVVDVELENVKEKTTQTAEIKKKSVASSVAEGKEFSFNG